MAGIRIELEGDKQAAAALRTSAARARDPRGVWSEIGRILVNSTQDRFEAERDPDGNPWPKSIRVLVEGGRTLRDSGRLYQSITFELLANGVAVGTNAIYAAVHQFGAIIQAKSAPFLAFMVGGHFVRKEQVTIPRRAFLGIDAGDQAEISFAWEEWLGEPVGGIHAR